MKQKRIAECKCNSLAPYSGKEVNGKIEYGKNLMKHRKIYLAVFIGCLLMTVIYPHAQNTLRKPETFDKMIEFSKILSKGFPHVRVDFYAKYIPEYIYSVKIEPKVNNRIKVLPFEDKNLLGGVPNLM